MKISQLPTGIKEKAIVYRNVADQEFWNNESDNLFNAFDWGNTEEGRFFWRDWHLKEYDLTHQLQQLSTQYPNDLEFGAQVRKLISEL
jgi:hypothetical protein